MSVVVKKVLVFCIVLLTACSKEPVEPATEMMMSLLRGNYDEFEYISDFIRQRGFTRISYDSVYPNNMENSGLDEYRLRLKNLGIYQGIQYHSDDDYVEVLFWSMGIVSRGKTKVFLRVYKDIGEIEYLQSKLISGDLKCEKYSNKWYVCLEKQ